MKPSSSAIQRREKESNNKEKEGNENRPIKIWKGNNLVD